MGSWLITDDLLDALRLLDNGARNSLNALEVQRLVVAPAFRVLTERRVRFMPPVLIPRVLVLKASRRCAAAHAAAGLLRAVALFSEDAHDATALIR